MIARPLPPGFRTLSTARGRYVVTPAGVVIGWKHKPRMRKPTPLPTVAANDDSLDAATGILWAVIGSLSLWCVGVLGWLLLRS